MTRTCEKAPPERGLVCGRFCGISRELRGDRGSIDYVKDRCFLLVVEFGPSRQYTFEFVISSSTSDLIEVFLPDVPEVVPTLHLLAVTGDGVDSPRIFEVFPKVLYGIPAQCLEQVFPRLGVERPKNRPEPLVLIACA